MQETFDSVTIEYVLRDMKNRNKESIGRQIRVYFGAEDGTTEYDKDSSNFKVGVIASDQTVGLVLLRCMRYQFIGKHLFDQDKMYSKDDANCMVSEPYENFLLYIGSLEANHVSREITDQTLRSLIDMDVWTVRRLMNALIPNIPENIEDETDDEDEDEDEEEDIYADMPELVDVPNEEPNNEIIQANDNVVPVYNTDNTQEFI